MTDNKGHIEEEIWFSSVSEEELAKYDKEAAFAAFKQRVALTEQEQQKATIHRLGWLKYAAVVAAVVVVGFFSYKGGKSQLESSLGDIVVEAPLGSRSEMTLPDGTKVWLNAGSKISYSQGFSIVNRLVSLVGEGYFEVARNEQLPFSVVSGNATVKVLGTKFDFRDYPDDAEATVSLLEGKVVMSDSRDQNDTYLTPGQRAIMNKKSGRIQVTDYTVDNSIQWTKGRLIFDGEPLADIIKDLERSYNVKVVIANGELLKLHFHGDFIRQEQSLGEVLDALSKTGKVNYKIEGQNVTLY